LQEAPALEGRHLILFDGECGLCDRFVQFVLRHDRRGVFRFAPLQSGVGRAAVAQAGGDPNVLTTMYVVADFQGGGRRILTRSQAALFVAEQLGWPWRLALVARAVPRPLLDRIYNFVARSRYQVLGRLEHCMMPTPEFRQRFLE
jgi:predicted DCC family thiol-disulfide oxidoreductase YuxK